MDNNDSIINTFYNNNYIKPPEFCVCGNSKIKLNKYSKYKINPYCFRCTKRNCKKIYPLLKGSFFDKFKFLPLNVSYDILRCFIEYEFNAKSALNYLVNTKFYTLSDKIIHEFYTEIRKIIYKYYLIEYETETLGTENANHFYAVDESNMAKDLNGNKIWCLGIKETQGPNFRIVLTRERDAATLKRFITKFIPAGNNIISDGWAGYEWINNLNSGYRHYTHLHGRRDFGRAEESTSHIEQLWAQIKKRIFATYKMIPSENLLYFIKEIEWKIKVKTKSYPEKLKDFFEMFDLVSIVNEDNLKDPYFLNNDEINN